MKQQSRIHQFLAFSLLLVFTVQAGLGLWLHRIFHQPSSSVAAAQIESRSHAVVSSADASINCSCIDDFLVPFTESSSNQLPKAVSSAFVQQTTVFYQYVPHSLRIFRSLRAPPAFS